MEVAPCAAGSANADAGSSVTRSRRAAAAATVGLVPCRTARAAARVDRDGAARSLWVGHLATRVRRYGVVCDSGGDDSFAFPWEDRQFGATPPGRCSSCPSGGHVMFFLSFR